MDTNSETGVPSGVWTYPLTSTAAPRTRVLVVDDDRAIRDLVRCVLEMEGYEVECAKDGQDALDLLLTATRPWVVLMDVMMPRVSGIEVCQRLCATETTAPFHRVALMTAGLLEASDCPPPVRALVRKPFDVDHLIAVVGALAAELAASELLGALVDAPEMAASLA